jgi:hypothetical protein
VRRVNSDAQPPAASLSRPVARSGPPMGFGRAPVRGGPSRRDKNHAHDCRKKNGKNSRKKYIMHTENIDLITIKSMMHKFYTIVFQYFIIISFSLFFKK